MKLKCGGWEFKSDFTCSDAPNADFRTPCRSEKLSPATSIDVTAASNSNCGFGIVIHRARLGNSAAAFGVSAPDQFRKLVTSYSSSGIPLRAAKSFDLRLHIYVLAR